jgi:predicted nucleotidyltransferase
MKSREEDLSILTLKGDLESRFHDKKNWIFGSVARNENYEGRDQDLWLIFRSLLECSNFWNFRISFVLPWKST